MAEILATQGKVLRIEWRTEKKRPTQMHSIKEVEPLDALQEIAMLMSERDAQEYGEVSWTFVPGGGFDITPGTQAVVEYNGINKVAIEEWRVRFEFKAHTS